MIELQRDNEKGLGFKVVEGAQGGVITISSITPGGPAEKVSLSHILNTSSNTITCPRHGFFPRKTELSQVRL